ncbi:LysR family transcriptional regulator [Ralstonia wenshanensis]|uniref:LysR family transcriptional regulator n=1 Tax=Ralstonia wenshanensis TaxID=2842456 RepID=UPI002AAE06D5|nr:LysR family transcriptional regulator [Ralstonia wenshanensis]MDY7507265.1 LysR family transcriptional regulator [Ralstonia wenshanensis]
MTPTLKQVKALVALYKHRHFGNAANELHISQPAFSRIIQDLERIVGGALVDRSSRSVQLTPLGERFARLGEELLHTWETNFNIKKSSGFELTKPVKIAMGPALANMLIPVLLGNRKSSSFNKRASIMVGSCRRVIANVYQGDIDIGVCSLVEGPYVYHEELLSSRIGVLISGDSNVHMDHVSPRDIATHPLIRLKADDFMYNMVAAHCPELITAMADAPEINDLGTILQVVRSGICAAIVSSVTASHPLARDLKFIPFSHNFMQRKFFIICKSGREEEPFICQLFNSMKEAARSTPWHQGVMLAVEKEP